MGDYCEPVSTSSKSSLFQLALRDAPAFFLNPFVIAIFGGLVNFVYWRLCLAPRSFATGRFILMTSFCLTIALSINLLVYFCGRVLYKATECHSQWRGLSDVMLVLACVCNVVLTVIITTLVGSSLRAADNGALLQSIAEHRARGDPNVLAIDVSAARLRTFLDAEQPGELQQEKASTKHFPWCTFIVFASLFPTLVLIL